MSLFRKYFCKKAPDRLVEISERVYAFDSCFSSHVMGEDEYKVYLDGIVEQLHDHYPDASFMVFNFREGEERSQISDVLSHYGMTVMDYPNQYEGVPLLPLEMIHHFLTSSESWLSLEGQQNVLLMHCEAGAWPVLDFMLSGLLLYLNRYHGDQKTLEMANNQASVELLRLSSTLNPQPSQLRYLRYISRRDLGSHWPPSDAPLHLECLILRGLPLSERRKDWRPSLRVYGQDPNPRANRSSMLLFSTPNTHRLHQQEECILVKLDIQCRVQGDVVLECIHLHDDLVREEMVFRIMFHTAVFVRGNVLIVQRDEMDMLWDATDQFTEEFKAEVLFSRADAMAPTVTTAPPMRERAPLPPRHLMRGGAPPPPPPPPPPPLPLMRGGAPPPPSPPRPPMRGGAPPPRPPPPPPPFRSGGPRRKLHYSKLLRPLRGSLWEELLIDGEGQTKPDFNVSETETLFSATVPKPAEKVHLVLFSGADAIAPTVTTAPPMRERAPPPPPPPPPPPRRERAPLPPRPLMRGRAPPPYRKDEGTRCRFPIAGLRRSFPLKPLHWVKVTRALPGSLWDELQRHGEGQTAPEFDVSEIETLFSATVPKPPDKSGGRRKPIWAKPEKVQLIDLRRANNTEIMLTKVKMPLPDMMAAVLAMDDTVLDIDQIENLIKFCPTKEEMELLKNYTGDKTTLGKCEQYFLELMKVPRIKSKLRVFSFKIQFGTQISELTKRLNVVNSACEEVRSSQKLKEVMKNIPYLRNTLHQGAARDVAVGFELKSLSILSHKRGPDSMRYLCKVLASDLLDFHKDLESLKSASKIRVKSLAEEMQAIVKGLTLLKQELTASESDGPVSQVFRESLKDFTSIAETEVATVSSLYSVVGNNADALVFYVGEDPKHCTFEEVTSTLVNFISLFKRAHDENVKQAELEKMGAATDAKKAKRLSLITKSELVSADIMETMLTKLKLPLPDMMAAVLAMDESVIDADQIESLIKFCPSKMEMELLQNYTGDKATLGKCEQYFLELMNVPRVESKLRVFSFKIQFGTQITEFKKSLNAVKSACEEIRTSQKLKEIMKKILYLGNTLNQGTSRGAAVGFKLDSLLKLSDTRAANSKMTLMHYLCKVLASKAPDLLDFHKDLESLESASKIQFKSLAEEMEAIVKGLKLLKQEFTASESDGPVSQVFRKILKDFIPVAEAEMATVSSLYSLVRNNGDALVYYLGDNPQHYPFEQVTTTLAEFISLFRKAHEENLQQAELEKMEAVKVASSENEEGS